MLRNNQNQIGGLVVGLVALATVLFAAFIFAHTHNVRASRGIFRGKMSLLQDRGVLVEGIDYDSCRIGVLDVSQTTLSNDELIEFLSTSAIDRVRTIKLSSNQAQDADALRSRFDVGDFSIVRNASE